ncbi:MAG: VCBS repeat-containing protein [Deltaproteobacteria bacterium]|nr:VCBS repeat-containing protein [Deltaproteobacteria bacterium]
MTNDDSRWILGRRIARGLGVTGAVMLASALGCASHAPSTPVEATSVPTTAAAESADVPADPGPTPPDGQWLTDDQGRQYFVDKLPRAQGTKVDAHTVRTVWSIPVEITGEDADYWYYKVYRPPEEPVPVTNPQPTAASLAAIEDSYRVELPVGKPMPFVDFGRGLPKSGQWREGFAIADANGDGHLDLVHGPARKSWGAPAIFLGDGAGDWKRWKGLSWPGLDYDYGDVAVGDLDGDGHADLALGVHLRGLMVLLGDGQGHFRDGGKGLDFTLPSSGFVGFSSRCVTLVDWNGDGRLDLLALGEGPRMMGGGGGASKQQVAGAHGVVLYLNLGNGAWKRVDQGTDPRQNFGAALVLGDFDGDGRNDFAAGTSFLGRRDIVNLAQPDGSWKAEDVPALRRNGFVNALAAADLDGTGRSALAVGYLSFEGEEWRTGVDVLRRGTDGLWSRTALAVQKTNRGVHSLAFGDLDGDGRADLVGVTDDGSTWVFRGTSSGGFERVADAIPRHPEQCRAAHVEVVDLDGDGRGEVVSSFADEVDPGLAGDRRECPSQGGLYAWTLAAKP